ncbi:hypothetical protein [Demequina oxidasica]|uniref:hypothetical protein n=1 Tax=Demequina oxidasica TaxID=676199 RepID=UPI00078574E3|nr:hypothetical protein [Demequina oxidasica]
MMMRVRSALTIASGALALGAALAGCSGADEMQVVAASCVPMTVESSPSPAISGRHVILLFTDVHAECNDTDPTAETAEPTTADVGLWEVSGSWRESDLGTLEKDTQDLSGRAEFLIPESAPAGTYGVMVFGREIGQIEVELP